MEEIGITTPKRNLWKEEAGICKVHVSKLFDHSISSKDIVLIIGQNGLENAPDNLVEVNL